MNVIHLYFNICAVKSFASLELSCLSGWINFNIILDKHLNMDESKGSIGLLTFQNCWACLKGQDHGHPSHKCDNSCPKKPGNKHRLDIQFKSKDIGEFIIE